MILIAHRATAGPQTLRTESAHREVPNGRVIKVRVGPRKVCAFLNAKRRAESEKTVEATGSRECCALGARGAKIVIVIVTALWKRV